MVRVSQSVFDSAPVPHGATALILTQVLRLHTCHNLHFRSPFHTFQDRPGFILYRVLMPMINEAFFCMMEGVGTPEDIDRGMRLGTNAALGPLKLADAIGGCNRESTRLWERGLGFNR